MEELILSLVIFSASLFVLVKGSDWFIQSAEDIGRSLNISPFIIGVTIVAFGTSLPELATSLVAVADGDSQIVIGNVIGSNITNILLVLGLVATVKKRVDIGYDILDIDIPLLVVSAIFFWFILQDGQYGLFEAILSIIALGIFLFNSLTNNEPSIEKPPKLAPKTILFFILGGAMVYFGADYTIFSLESIASGLGVGSELIALTLVALGTSLPEVVVSLTAAKKGQIGIAIGNVLGSNIFNTYAVMSISSFMGDLFIPASILDFALPFMVAITILFAIICISKRISRWEGSMLVIMYIYYVAQLFALDIPSI